MLRFDKKKQRGRASRDAIELDRKFVSTIQSIDRQADSFCLDYFLFGWTVLFISVKLTKQSSNT